MRNATSRKRHPGSILESLRMQKEKAPELDERRFLEHRAESLESKAQIFEQRAKNLDTKARILKKHDIAFSTQQTQKTMTLMQEEAHSLRFKADLLRNRALLFAEAALTQFQFEGGYLN